MGWNLEQTAKVPNSIYIKIYILVKVIDALSGVHCPIWVVCNSWGQINRLHSDWLAQYCVQLIYIFALLLEYVFAMLLEYAFAIVNIFWWYNRVNIAGEIILKKWHLEYPGRLYWLAQYWHRLTSCFSISLEYFKKLILNVLLSFNHSLFPKRIY